MSLRLPSMNASLVLNSSQFNQAMKGTVLVAKESADDIIGYFEGVDQLLTAISVGMMSVGAGMVASTAPGIVQAQRFESAMARVFALIDPTEAEMRRLNAAVLDMGRNVRGPIELADALVDLASAGFTIDQQLAILPETIRLSTASLIEMDAASELLIQTMAAFNIEAADAARITNVIAAANAISTADATRLAEAYSMVGANAASQNLTLEETTAALSILIDVFQSGEQAGTSFRNVITRLAAGTSELRNAASKAGIPIRELNPSIVGVNAAVLRLRDLLASGASAWDIFGDRGQTAANILAQNADRFGEVEAAITGTDALLRQFQIQTNTTETGLRSLMNQATVTSIAFAQGFKPIIDITTGALRFLLEIVNAIPQPLKTLMGLGVAIAGTYIVWHGVLLRLLALYLSIPDAARSSVAVIRVLDKALLMVGIRIELVRKITQALTWQNIQLAASGNAAAAAALRQAGVYTTMAARFALQAIVIKPVIILYNALRTALMLLLRVPFLQWIVVGALLLREMARHGNILRPAIEAVRTALGNLVSIIPGIENLNDLMRLLSQAFQVVAIAAVEILARAMARVSQVINRTAAEWRAFVQYLNPKNWNAEDFRRIGDEYATAIAEIDEEFRELLGTIDDVAQADTNAVFGIYEDATTALAAKLGITTEELERQRLALIAFREEAQRTSDQLIFDLDATPLERTLAGINDNVHTLLDELDAYLDENPLIGLVDWDGNEVEDIAESMYADIVRMYETAAETAKDIAVGDFIADLQRQLDDAQVQAMSEGTERLARENDQRITQLEADRERALRAFTEGSEDYIRISEIYDGLILASREEYAADLRKLEDEIIDDVEGFERRVVEARIAGMDEGEAQIRARTALSVQTIRRDIADRLSTMEAGTDAYERLLVAERELIALEYAAQDREIARFNTELNQRMREREAAFQENLNALERQLRDIATDSETDPLIALLNKQQDALAENANTYLGYLDQIAEDVDDGLITTEQAEERRLALLQAYGAAQNAQLEANLTEQNRILAEREATEIAFAQRIAEIQTSTRIAGIDDPVEKAKAEQQAQLAALEAWYAEQVTLAGENAETLANIETEYQAERLKRVTLGNIAIGEALERERAQRITAETNAARRLADHGIAGVITQDTLTLALARLQALRQEMIAAGAAADELVTLGESIATLSGNITDLGSASFDDFLTTLTTLRDGVADLEDQLLSDDEQEAASTARLFATWDEQFQEFSTLQRARASSAEEAELRIAEVAALIERRKLVHTQLIERRRAEAAAARVAAVQDFEQSLLEDRVDTAIAGIRDETAQAQAAYDEDARRRRAAFQQQLDDLEATHTERLRLTRAFNAHEALLAAEHQEDLAAIQARAVQDSLTAFVDQQARVRNAVASAAQAAAEAAITADVDTAIAQTEERIDVTERQIDALKEETDALKARNDELLASLNLVPTLREYLDNVEALFGADLVFTGDIVAPLRSLESQRDLAEDLYRQAVEANLPLQQRMQLMRDLVDLNEQVVEAGGEGLRSDRTLVDAARNEYVDAADAARTAAGEYADNTARLNELETATQASTTALEALRETIEALNDDLERLRAQTGGQLFNEATGQFQDLEDAAADAGETYRNTIAAALLGEGLPADKATWLTAVIEGLEAGGRDLEDALYILSYAGGTQVPTGILQGFLDSPAPFTDDGQTVAEHLGLDNSYDAAVDIGKRVAQRLGEGFEGETGASDTGQEWIDTTQDALADSVAPLQAQVVDMGTTAGIGLMQAFANGILNNRQVILNAVETVLQDVRELLPSSDAKRGPLSDLTHSGTMLVKTFAGGASGTRSWLARSIERTFAAARPSIHTGALRTHGLYGPQYAGAGGGNSPIIGTLNVDGRNANPTPGALGMTARPLVEQALREAGIQNRMRGRTR